MIIMWQNRQNSLSEKTSCQERWLLFHVMENTLLLSQSREFKPWKTTDKCFFFHSGAQEIFYITDRYSSQHSIAIQAYKSCPMI
jgi:hypothetical protein